MSQNQETTNQIINLEFFNIMDLQEFIINFAYQFEDADSSEIKAETEFKELDEWGSLTTLGVIAMVKTEYEKTVTGAEIRSCTTVEDLFHLLEKK